MDIVATMRLYGQPIFFWIMGTVLMGYAIEKHGLAHRFTIAFLALPGLGGKTTRLTFAYMLIVGLISVFVSDAATIAMTIPIGMAIVRHTRPQGERKQFAAFMTLGDAVRRDRWRHRDHHWRSSQCDRDGGTRSV